MIWPRKKHMRPRMSRTIGLNVRGRPEPEVYRVCEDVYGIVRKMLSANQAIGPFHDILGSDSRRSRLSWPSSGPPLPRQTRTTTPRWISGYRRGDSTGG